MSKGHCCKFGQARTARVCTDPTAGDARRICIASARGWADGQSLLSVLTQAYAPNPTTYGCSLVGRPFKITGVEWRVCARVGWREESGYDVPFVAAHHTYIYCPFLFKGQLWSCIEVIGANSTIDVRNGQGWTGGPIKLLRPVADPCHPHMDVTV